MRHMRTMACQCGTMIFEQPLHATYLSKLCTVCVYVYVCVCCVLCVCCVCVCVCMCGFGVALCIIMLRYVVAHYVYVHNMYKVCKFDASVCACMHECTCVCACTSYYIYNT